MRSSPPLNSYTSPSPFRCHGHSTNQGYSSSARYPRPRCGDEIPSNISERANDTHERTLSKTESAGVMSRPVVVAESWGRIVDWCRAHAPSTFQGIRPPASAPAIEAAMSVMSAEWPAELVQWYGLHDGVEHGDRGLLPGAYSPLDLASIASMWLTYRKDWDVRAAERLDERELAKIAALGGDSSRRIRYDIAACERQPAGSVASMFLPSFVPIGNNGAACELFIDTRSGPMFGCVTEYLREDADHSGPRWTSLGAMLADTAHCLTMQQASDIWTPTVDQGYLTWTIR